MSSTFNVGIAGFDFTPAIHPEYGAWGTTPGMTEVDMPLLGRCIALSQGEDLLLWYGIDICGNPPKEVAAIRDELASALSLQRRQIIWSTSQTHSSPTLPGSDVPGGSCITERGSYDTDYCNAQRRVFMQKCIDAGRQAIDSRQPAQIRAGSGFCDSISYNTRFPMPNGGVKFSRHHTEGLQSGKFFDPTVGLVVFEDESGKPLGAIFNFCSHPATMINDKYVSPDWVGTARAEIEGAIGSAPAMHVQGFCGDVNCHHIFGTPAQARSTGLRLGKAAVEALPTLIPARATPFAVRTETIQIDCRPMYTHPELDYALKLRRDYIDSLATDPAATWFAGINAPEFMNAKEKTAFVQVQIDYLEEGQRILETGESVRDQLDFELTAVRMGDVAAIMSYGENFTQTGAKIRHRSPFVHTLICGDSNGLWGYLGDDDEIDRRGYETDSYWKMLFTDGFRRAPAKGSVDRIIDTSVRMLWDLQQHKG